MLVLCNGSIQDNCFKDKIAVFKMDWRGMGDGLLFEIIPAQCPFTLSFLTHNIGNSNCVVYVFLGM